MSRNENSIALGQKDPLPIENHSVLAESHPDPLHLMYCAFECGFVFGDSWIFFRILTKTLSKNNNDPLKLSLYLLSS